VTTVPSIDIGFRHVQYPTLLDLTSLATDTRGRHNIDNSLDNLLSTTKMAKLGPNDCPALKPNTSIRNSISIIIQICFIGFTIIY
jgi:hypothetical protein